MSGMADSRDAFLSAADSALELLARREVADRWDEPSVLAEWNVAGLSGHLASQVLNVAKVLDAPVGGHQPIQLLQHYGGVSWTVATVDDEVNVAIRRGGDELAAAGPEQLVARTRAVRDQVADRLAAAELQQPVFIPWTGWALTLEDFLCTRMMEIVVHADDVAASVVLEPPPFAADVFEPVLWLLARLAVVRHGQPAVLRALTRRERAPESVVAF
jgi:hypothetical protein